MKVCSTSNGKRHAVIRACSGPPTIEMLEGTMQPDCSSWVIAWCPDFETAKRIQAAWNAAEDQRESPFRRDVVWVVDTLNPWLRPA